MASQQGCPDEDRTTLLDSVEPVQPADQSRPVVGQRIGPYKLVALLGEGGMGQVFLAEQIEPIWRRVALKLIRYQLIGGLAEAYFEVERQALARMDHPSIAKVFDAGRTDEGYTYLVMEFVEGRPLDVWRDEEQPDERERIRAIIALAYGVQHAHQRGIVHRDLKPANIIMSEVDGHLRPKLIDFGIAIGIDQGSSDSVRNSYERAGSGPYMSPEQYADDNSDIDTRSDVYSMGVVLLSLLLPSGLRDLGEPSPEREQLHNRLLESLQRSGIERALDDIPAELRHIAAKATRPRRDERYPSAIALAEDLQRYLDRYPVEAVPSTAGYRLRKFVVRRRRALALLTLALLALVIGLATAIWGLIRAADETRRAQATSQFLSTVLAGVNPDLARDLDKTLMRQVLDSAAERATHELRALPDALAEIESTIAISYMGLGEQEKAIAHAERAYKLAIDLHGPNDRRVATEGRVYGRLLLDIGKYAEAEKVLNDSLIVSDRVDGKDSTLSTRLRMTQALLLRDTGHYPQALDLASEVLATQERTLGSDSEYTLDTQFVLAIILSDLERWNESIALYKHMIDVRSRTIGADHPTTLSLRNSLAVAYLQSERFAEGEDVLREAIPLYEKVFGKDSSLTHMLLGNLGGALRQQGKIEESGPYYLRAADGYRERYGADHPYSIQSSGNHANYLLDAKRFEEAYRVQSDALQRSRIVFGEEHPTTAEILTGIGRAELALGRHDEAERDLLTSLAIREKLLGRDSTRLRPTIEALIELYDKTRRTEEAVKLRERLLDNRKPAATTP
jgi:non-specific serine/threonine protein kinase/serine/threonine-protein kinase